MPDLRHIILEGAVVLQPKMPWADAIQVLGAIAEVESSFGKYNIPKHEKAFDAGGRFFNFTLWEKYGSWAACSYSSFQLMFPVAWELGFPGGPLDLCKDETAIYWVLEYIDHRILQKGCKNLKDFADAYNSGSFKDRIIPDDYIEKFLKAYDTVTDAHELKG